MSWQGVAGSSSFGFRYIHCSLNMELFKNSTVTGGNMRIICSCAIVALAVSFIAAAEKKGWVIDADANVTVTQNAYSNSWIGGERGSLSWASRLNFVAEKQLNSWFNHRNTLKLNYGQTKNQNDNKSWGDFAKSADLIDFETLQRFSIGKKTEPFVAVRLISQFMDERDSMTTHYGNPVNVTESFGASRSLVTRDALTWGARIGGAVQQAIDRYSYDVDKREHVTDVVNNAGFELVTEMKASLREGLFDYSGLLTVFQAVISSESENDAGSGTPYWQYPDLNWENILSVNLTKYIMVNATVQLLYDREKHADARIKEVMAIGLTYKFNNAPKAAAK